MLQCCISSKMCSWRPGDDGKREHWRRSGTVRTPKSVRQRALAAFTVAARVSSVGSDAPVCASLIWVAFAKSGLLAHACDDDRAMTTYAETRLGKNIHAVAIGPALAVLVNRNSTGRKSSPVAAVPHSARCRRSSHPGQPLHPRGLRPHCHGATSA